MEQILRYLFLAFTKFPFTTTEMELDYYNQRVNKSFASQEAGLFKKLYLGEGNHEVSRKTMICPKSI